MGSTLVAPTFVNSHAFDGIVILISSFFNSFWFRSLCTEQKFNPAQYSYKEPHPQLVSAGVAKQVKMPELVLVSRWDQQLLRDMALFLKAIKAFFDRSIRISSVVDML